MEPKARSKPGQSSEDRPPKDRKDPDLRVWAVKGKEAAFFQREATVNFWTVLGGLAMGALLTQLGPAWEQMQVGRWYLFLYILASLLTLASSWVQTTWGSLVMKWSISIIGTVAVLFQMLCQSLQCLLVTNPSGWLAATAGILLTALIIQVYFERSGAWQFFSPGRINSIKVTNWVYVGFLVLTITGALQLHFLRSILAEIIWGFVVLFSSILSLVMLHQGMQVEKKELGVP